MWVLIGFGRDRPQESHDWHMQKTVWDAIPERATITVEGDDPTRLRRDGSHIIAGALMHFTFLGGLHRYVVLEVGGITDHWHVGWRHDWRGERECDVQKLPITKNRIRILSGYQGTKTEFFAVDDSGSFLPLRIVGEGKIGDGKFPKVRLF